MNSNIINLNSDREYESSIVGGKGKSLIWMKRNGIDVPEGFVVSAFCFDKYYEKAKKEHGIPKELEEELFAAYDRIIGSGLVAVRSSATNMTVCYMWIKRIYLRRLSRSGFLWKHVIAIVPQRKWILRKWLL